jgi:hypothetical protein
MNNPQNPTAEAAARLARALSAQDDLAHEQAEALIPSLIEAEGSGEAVDANPAFAALLCHLDHCERCLNLYEQLAADFEAVVGEAEVLPSVAPSVPVFFDKPIPKGDHVVLQIVRGMLRRFTLTFDFPRLAPALATLGGPQRSLYTGTLPEVDGAPLLAVTAGRDAEGVWLQVAVREPGQRTSWRLQLDLGAQTLTTTTDVRGIARFTLPPDVQLGSVRLHCEELLAADEGK